ncbi:addiction module antidote protein [Kiloniella laminariae]|uniref:addiction module antidote protein n=1 Tax=Kiloniella laminariae TaxID=454162 RepID=UPI00039CFA6B|nr:addiction module antidote protein [Kiloniella laminariae]
MAEKLTTFDVTKYLDDDEAIAIFLTDALETGDLGYINMAIGEIARARGMTDIAKKSGVKREALYKALSETGNPHFKTVMAVTEALGLKMSFTPAA